MAELRIGFDAKRVVRNATGLGSYGRTLVNDLIRKCEAGADMQLFLYAPDEGRADLRGQIIDSPHASFVYPKHGGSLGKALWRMKGITRDLVRDGINVYHGLSGELPIGLRRAGIRGVVTIHDLIFMRHPEYYNWIDTKIYAWKFFKTLREAERIIAISECTKRDIVELGNVSPDKIDVVYQSCNPRFTSVCSEQETQRVSRKFALPRRYILQVGSIERRKNAMLPLKALSALPDDVSLVLVGKRTPYTHDLEQYAQANGIADRLYIYNNVGDEDLAAVYALAEVFVYASRYEGFGIPIIEAIGSGLPVVACTGSCLEEAGGADCLYVAPDDVSGMAAAVRSQLVGAVGREQRIAASQAYIKRFAGLDVAGQVEEVYQFVIPHTTNPIKGTP